MIRISADYSTNFSYARLQCGMPAVRSISLKNTSQEAVGDLLVTVNFDPEIAPERKIAVGGINGKGKVVLDDLRVMPSPSYLAGLTEEIPAVMRVTVAPVHPETDGEILAQECFPVRLLPYDFWEGASLSPELLACFVTPNHPAIRPILSRASEKLGNWTGNPSLTEYQSGSPDAVKRQMAAIYEALREMNISYASVPASFSKSGQRVRMPEDVTTAMMANCLDSALLYAGCLEAAGIHPLIVLHEGHAYAGGWLVNDSFPLPVDDDPAGLSKRVADGINEVILVETTKCMDGCGLPFDKAAGIAAGMVKDADDFVCCVDVKTCRNLGILPLPLRVLTGEGYIIEKETEVTRERPAAVPSTDVIDLEAPAVVDKHTIWERKLLDLTLRNDLVNVHSKKGILQLISSCPEETVAQLEDGRSFGVFGSPVDWVAELLVPGIFSPVGPSDPVSSFGLAESRDGRLHACLPAPVTALAMDDLRRNARHSIEENGANTLFLTVGALKWIDDDCGNFHVAPILLIPVEISKATLSIKATGEDITANLTLLEMLRQQYGISVPGLDNLPESKGHTDVRRVMNTIRRAVMEKKGWDVLDLMFIGNFTFNKFIIWNDIHTHRSLLDSNPAVASLVEGKLKVKDVRGGRDGSVGIDVLCPSGDILQPISADSSQLRAIRDAVDGRSFVMHGPPGTGKSQTITNIIANFLYRGKRVLFVSEKKAALEVVQKRLEEIGLDPFCLELHSNKARKGVVLAKLGATLEAGRGEAQDGFKGEAEDFDGCKAFLNGHVEALHRVYPAGLSLYDCVSACLSMDERLPSRRLPLSLLRGLTPAGISSMSADVDDYVTAVRHTGIDGSCQLLDLPLSEYTPAFQEKLVSDIERTLSRKGLRFWLACRRFERELGASVGTELSRSALASVRAKLARWLNGAGQMRNYAIYSNQRANICSLGLGAVADAYEKGEVDSDHIKDFFIKSLHQSYAEMILGREKSLNLFCGDIFESTIRKFRDMDAGFNELSRKQMYRKVASTLPDPAVAAADPEMAILKKAIRNNARGISLRNLFDKIPHLLPRLCPCMLMSPLSVSQYLQPDGGMFDLVIFDEASQLPTSEAVAAIARGRSLIVVGDPQQLPPTSFFERDNFDEDNAEKEDLESILDECIALSLPSVHLRWHYRSHHESLIAFSNCNYYDNRLLTFPSNDDLATKVHFVEVNGVYDRGRTRTNEAEADALAAEVRRRLADENLRGQSIGIVTFNVSQQHLVEKKIDEMLSKNKALARVAAEQEEPIFVKSLENVQGDERDVILFSVGYGRDKRGHMSLNFGPLNQDGGWRRLNVAVSRARCEMMVFSSVQPEDLIGDGYIARGVLDLRSFLRYARDGRECLDLPEAAEARRDVFVEKVAAEMRAEGANVRTGIGTSDFRVDIGVVDPSNPERYLYGIMCDGPMYASAQAARDREIIRPEVLQRLGWNIRRKWILDRYGQ